MTFFMGNWRLLFSIGKMMLAMVVAAFIFTKKLERRKHFAGRLALTLAVITAFSLAFWMNLNENHYLLSSILWYFAMLLLCICGIAYCFRCSFHVALPLGACAAATQHLYRDVVQIIEGWGYTSEAIGEGWYNLYGMAVMAGVYTVIYFLFGRRASMLHENQKMPAQEVLSVLMILFIGTFSKISVNGAGVTPAISQNFFFYDIVGLMFCLAMLFEMFNSASLRVEKERIVQALHAKNEYYQISKENIELINIKCHDMRHQVRALAQSEGNVHRYRQMVESIINVYDNTFRTGNEALDIVLTEKSLLCSQNGIQITCMVDGAALSFMDSMDIYSLFGNLLDNAIASVKELSEEQKLIDLSVAQKGSLVYMRVMNCFVGELVFRDGLPVTTKEDKTYHGFGLKSIRMIAQKYGGTMKVEAEDGYFVVSLLLSAAETAAA